MIEFFLKRKPRITTRDKRFRIYPKLVEIRDKLKELGNFSWTSDYYQNDALTCLLECADVDGVIFEGGCYKGGLTAQLVAVAEMLGKELYYVDIDPQFIETTGNLLKNLGLSGHTHGEAGTLKDFAQRNPDIKIAVAVIDMDHKYEAVIEDIEILLSLKYPPAEIFFHDYGLRSEITGEDVARAVTEKLSQYPSIPVGQKFTGEGHATRENPSEDGHYWAVPSSEGIRVKLR